MQIAILGAGSWGTALAVLMARNGHQVALWDHSNDHIEDIVTYGENRQFLPGIPIANNIQPCSDLSTAIEACSILLIVVPSHAFRSVLLQAQPFITSNMNVCWATKGFEPGTSRLLSDVAREVLGPINISVISGPTFAMEVARGLPTALTVASSDVSFSEDVAMAMHGESLRAYTSSDIIGVQVGGAVKNVMAIAAGIADGLGYGANTRAALITRGLAEITRLGESLGAKPETFMGLAGLGDLALTCTDNQSRNRRMGLALARGVGIDQAKMEIGQEVEGVATTKEVHNLAVHYQIDMPITNEVYKVLYEGLPPLDAVNNLLCRRIRPELG